VTNKWDKFPGFRLLKYCSHILKIILDIRQKCFVFDDETAKLYLVSLRPSHKQADLTSNDARPEVYVRVDPNASAVTSAEIFRGHARGIVRWS